jgi:hypothetical protein
MPDFSWNKHTKTENITNDHKLYQTDINYTKWSWNTYTNIYDSKALQNLPKFGILGLKTNHLATLPEIRWLWTMLVFSEPLLSWFYKPAGSNITGVWYLYKSIYFVPICWIFRHTNIYFIQTSLKGAADCKATFQTMHLTVIWWQISIARLRKGWVRF